MPEDLSVFFLVLTLLVRRQPVGIWLLAAVEPTCDRVATLLQLVELLRVAALSLHFHQKGKVKDISVLPRKFADFGVLHLVVRRLQHVPPRGEHVGRVRLL